MKPDEFITEMLAGDQHRGGIRCQPLFEIAGETFKTLCREVRQYQSQHRPSRVNEAHHITHWVDCNGPVAQYSLLNGSGRSDDFSNDHNLSCRGKWFFDADRFPTLGRLINDWPDPINFRLNLLAPGAALSPHEEHLPFRTRNGATGLRLRFHLPIETRQGAELLLDGWAYRLEAGIVYLVNQGCVHAAFNHSDENRLHLVWDSLLTEKVFNFLFAEQPPTPYLILNRQRSQQPLRQQNTGAYRRLPPTLSVEEAMTATLCDPQ